MNTRETSPLLVNWFVNLFITVVTGIYLYRNFNKDTWKEIKKGRTLIFWTCLLDNLAWVAYSFSTIYAPIAIATGLSESYIVIACILGLIFNKERLLKHQYLGIVITITSGVALAFTI